MKHVFSSTAATIGVYESFLAPSFAKDNMDYDNPDMPDAPEERSGLVVLRVAEVCNFQENILRAVVAKDIDATVSPQQIIIGTKILLKIAI